MESFTIRVTKRVYNKRLSTLVRVRLLAKPHGRRPKTKTEKRFGKKNKQIKTLKVVNIFLFFCAKTNSNKVDFVVTVIDCFFDFSMTLWHFFKVRL